VILRSALVLGVCLGFAVLESVFPFVLHLREARADLLLVVVLYLALNDEVIPGASLSLAACLFYFVAPGSEGLVLKFPPLLWSALATAIAAPFVFFVLRRLDKGFLPLDAAVRVR